MGYHAFSLDPRAVLGVSPNSTLDEIREAYHAKSKKHHPDLGGDEWAFRMVVRAYQVLKTTTDSASTPWICRWPGENDSGPRHDWSRAGGVPSGGGDAESFGRHGCTRAQASGPVEPPASGNDEDTGRAAREADEVTVDPIGFQTVDVELIWTRFEQDVPGRFVSLQDETDATLSVCMVISWPPRELVELAVGFKYAGEVLRRLIGLFEQLHGADSLVSGRSRIEDGRFVGWLSYPNVLAAQDAFLALRRTLGVQGVTVKLRTRDERVPYAWFGFPSRG
jgi:hypothetical protein